MGFWTDFRSFLRTRTEILDRLDVLERKMVTLDHNLTDLDEFAHRTARKRYQDDYVPPAKAQTPQEGPAQLDLVPPTAPLTKAQLRASYLQKYGGNRAP